MKFAKTLSLALPLMLALGCQTPQKSDNAHFFTPGEDQVALQGWSDRQAAAATRADSSLYASHFSGENLNSLGKAKLDSIMLGCDGNATTEIYLIDKCDTPEHRTAITAYLDHHGWKSEQYAFVAGTNPDSYTNAAQSVNDLDKLNGQGLTEASSSSGMAAGAGAAPGAK
ncbi:MAG TPA: hypothetical protein VGG19_17950 [Tepidisphaeraceae bacterium]